jgi:hypothetical protein
LTTLSTGTLNWIAFQQDGSIENINSTSVSMSNSFEGPVEIDRMTVFYKL